MRNTSASGPASGLTGGAPRKRILVVACLFVLYLTQAAFGQSEPTVSAHLKQSAAPSFLDSSQVYGNGNAWFGLRASTDGGRSWHKLSFTADELRILGLSKDQVVQTEFVSSSTGWLINDSGTWKTSNGGLRWSRSSASDLTSIAFADRLHGWMQVWQPSGRVLDFRRTVDGGQTWIECRNHPTYWVEFAGSPFFFSTTHLATAMLKGSPPKPYFASSIDGGCFWSLYRIPDALYDHFATPYFLNNVQGWMPGAYLGSLLHTDDSGKTWHPLRVALRENGHTLAPSAILSVYFASIAHGWVLAYDRTTFSPIYSTVDAGKSWRRETALSFLDDYRSSVVNARQRWDVGARIAFILQQKI